MSKEEVVKCENLNFMFLKINQKNHEVAIKEDMFYLFGIKEIKIGKEIKYEKSLPKMTKKHELNLYRLPASSAKELSEDLAKEINKMAWNCYNIAEGLYGSIRAKMKLKKALKMINDVVSDHKKPVDLIKDNDLSL